MTVCHVTTLNGIKVEVLPVENDVKVGIIDSMNVTSSKEQIYNFAFFECQKKKSYAIFKPRGF